MAQKSTLKFFPINPPSLIKRMLIGAVVGLGLIAVFLHGANPDPAWGQYWWIRPFIVVPLAGATGGAFNYFIVQQNYRNRWLKIVAIIGSFVVFLIGLWMGMVVGLDGTYWN